MLESAVPVDRGWAWVVVLGAFMNLAILIGIDKCFGIIFAELIEKYQGTASSTSSMFAVSAALSLFLAPLVATLSDVYTCRIVSMTGAVLCSLGFLIPGYSSSLAQIVISFGIFTGLGYGFCLVPSTVIVGQYFDRYRSLANGLMFSGSGIGGMIVPLFLNYLIELVGLHGAFVTLAAMALQCVVFSCLYRPMEYWTKTRRGSMGPEEELEVNVINPEGALLAAAEEDRSVKRTRRSSMENTRIQNGHEGDPSFPQLGGSNVYLNVPTLSLPRKESRAESNTTVYFSTRNLATWPSLRAFQSVSKRQCDMSTQTETEMPPDQGCCATVRQLLRKACFVKTVGGADVPLCDLSLLKHGQFLCFIIASAFILTYSYIRMIIPPHCLELGLTKRETSFLLSAQGGADTAGRLLTAILGDRSFVKSRRLILLNLCCLVCSVTTFASIFLTNFWTLMAYLLVSALTVGAYIATVPVMLVDLVGVDKLSRAWGWTAFLEGFSITLCPLIIGALRDWTLSYYSSLIFIASCSTVATLSLFAVIIIEYRNGRRLELDSGLDTSE